MLNEDIRFTNKIIELCNIKKFGYCNSNVERCIISKIRNLILSLKRLIKNNNIRDKEFANEIMQSIDDLIREIIRNKNDCNDRYIKNLNNIKIIIAKLLI